MGSIQARAVSYGICFRSVVKRLEMRVFSVLVSEADGEAPYEST